LHGKPILFPFFSQVSREPTVQIVKPKPNDESQAAAATSKASHRLQIRDGTLKFRLNDGNLRIGRGFGKRSFMTEQQLDNGYNQDDVNR